MKEEKRIPLHIYNDYDPEKQREWLRKNEEKKKEEIKKQKRGCENIDFYLNIDYDSLLID